MRRELNVLNSSADNSGGLNGPLGKLPTNPSSCRFSAQPAVTVVLLGTYLGGFGASHPLAKKIGAWPSVFTVATLSGGASYVLADRRPTTATS